ncbi:MAG: FAD-binding oxidoreductase [bacterium]
MSTDIIRCESLLTEAEKAELDSFCRGHQGVSMLPELAPFLHNRFGVAMECDPDVVAGFALDSSNLPGVAQAVSRPATPRECAVVLRTCSQSGIPVTISSGKSNLTGSATPEGGVVLSLSRMMSADGAGGAAVVVDAAAKTVRGAVGMILEDLRRTVLKETGGVLFYPVDPTSRADAAVGGTVACNASGFIPGPSGATREWVRAVEFVLPDGGFIRAERGQYRSVDGRFVLEDGLSSREWPVPRYSRPTIKNAGGPFSASDGVLDLVDLVVGSEGLFGVVTGCTFNLRESPGGKLDLFFSLSDEAAALAFHRQVMTHLHGELGSLGALEYFGVNCVKHMDHHDVLFKGSDQVGIYLQVPLYGRSMEEAAEEWMDVITASGCGAHDDAIMLLDTERNWTMFMESRHSLPANALEVAKHRGTFTIMTDTVVPPDRFEEFLKFTHRILNEAGMEYVAFGHLGDCHLHFTLLPQCDQIEKGVALYDAIVAKSAELGGVYSGEHGTGKRKRRDFLRCYGAGAVEDVRRCKAVVDPGFVLNRGNVIEI